MYYKCNSKCNAMFALLRRSESCFLFRLYAPPDIRIYPLRLQAQPKTLYEVV